MRGYGQLRTFSLCVRIDRDSESHRHGDNPLPQPAEPSRPSPSSCILARQLLQTSSQCQQVERSVERCSIRLSLGCSTKLFVAPSLHSFSKGHCNSESAARRTKGASMQNCITAKHIDSWEGGIRRIEDGHWSGAGLLVGDGDGFDEVDEGKAWKATVWIVRMMLCCVCNKTVTFAPR